MGDQFLQQPWSVKPPLAVPSIDASNPLARGLQGAWFVNEGAGDTLYSAIRPRVLDGRYDLTLQNSPSRIAGPRGRAIELDGTNQRADLTHDAYFPNNSPFECTLVALARCEDTSPNQQVPIGLGSTTDGNWLALGFRGVGKGQVLRAQMRTQSDNANADTVFQWTPGVWYFMVGRFDYNGDTSDGTSNIFAGGEFAEAAMVAGGSQDEKMENLNRTLVGAVEDQGNGIILHLDGAVALGMVYDRWISDAEVWSLYENPYQVIQPRRRFAPAVDAGGGGGGNNRSMTLLGVGAPAA